MWDVEDGTGEWQPIGGTKDAASNFVGLLDTDTDRVGLFGWGSNCLNSFPVPVPEPFDYVNCLADWLYNELRTDDPLPSHFGIVQSTINNINSDEPRGDNLDGTFDHEDGNSESAY